MTGDLSILVIALVALLVLALLMRWIFRPTRDRRRQLVPGDAVPGLLVTVRTGLSRADALAQRAVLGDANIRSSMSARRDGRYDVLVFGADEEHARAILPPL